MTEVRINQECYATNIGRWIKVYHKINGGLSDARNYGVKKASGEWIAFVDSDDWIEEDMLNTLYNVACETKSDICICDFKYWMEEKSKEKKLGYRIRVYDSENALKEMLSAQKFASHACNKIFKKKLFSNIQFPKGKYYEDLYTIYKVMDIANKIAYINVQEYNYYIRKNSISTSKFNNKHLDYIEASQQIIDFIEKKYPRVKRTAYVNYNRNVMQTYDKLLASEIIDKDIENYLKMCMRKYSVYYNPFSKEEVKLACKKYLLTKQKKIYTWIIKRRKQMT